MGWAIIATQSFQNTMATAHQRAHVQEDVEQQLVLHIHAEKRLQEIEMAAGGDGQKLRQTLDQAQKGPRSTHSCQNRSFCL